MTTKNQLRTEMASRRRALDPIRLVQSSRCIIDRLMQLDCFKTAATVAVYRSIGGEVQTQPLIDSCWSSGRQVCIPAYSMTLNRYIMSKISPDTVYFKGHLGIEEPTPLLQTDVNTIDLMIVPGVAFDRSGGRLGRGGGYYDRILSVYTGRTVAVAFDFQLVDQIPVEPHDRPVDTVVTETKTIEVQHTD